MSSPDAGISSSISLADASTPSPPTSAPIHATSQHEKHFFGMKRDTPPNRYVFKDEYDKRFPDDAYCEETTSNAKVWRTYVEEAAAFDANMVGQSRDGLDVMLVFAGLFSAVVTSLLVQASQNLQADYGEMTAILLHDIVSIQLALADGISSVNITSPSINPNAQFVADGINVWVNGFWAVSLAASLAVALAAVLIKQWLHHYVSLHSGTPSRRSHLRHFRFTGLELWRVRIIIGILPIIMNLSLALFLSGLILFFIPLSASLAWAVGVITVLLCSLYLVSNALPIVFPQCPYQTPLSDFLNYAYQAVALLWRSLWREVETRLSASRAAGNSPSDSETTEHRFKSLLALETVSVQDTYDEVSVDALDWLYTVSSNPVVEEIVLLAIGGLPASAQQYAVSTWYDPEAMMHTRGRMVVKLTEEDPGTGRRVCHPGSEPALERIFRSFLFLPKKESSKFTWENQFQRISDARFDLALANTPMIQNVNSFEMRELLISYHGTLLHPLVWKELVMLAASSGAFRLDDAKLTAGAHAQFIAVVLPVLNPAYYSTTKPRTLQDTLKVFPLPAIWDYLLEMPSLLSFDSGSSVFSSTYDRVLLAAAKFAVHHIEKDTANVPIMRKLNGNGAFPSEAQCHWELLETVFRRLASSNGIITDARSVRRLASGTQAPLEEIARVMEKTITLAGFKDSENVNEGRPASVLRDRCMASILSLYSDIMAMKETPSCFPGPSIHRILHASTSRLVNNLDTLYSQRRLDYSLFCSILPSTCNVMAALLRSYDDQRAYRLFIDDKWIQTFGPLWVIGWGGGWPGEHTIGAYVSGLALPSMASSRQEYIDHLHEPDNLAIALCALVADAEKLRSLTKLYPAHPSWERCRALMAAILAWTRSPNCEAAEFPASLVDGKVVECSDRSIPMTEHLRKRFTGEKAKENLEKTIQVLDVNLPKPKERPDVDSHSQRWKLEVGL